MNKKNTQNQNSREADATIRGFEYQFLMTQKQILEEVENDLNAEFVIEGIEDLDIHSANIELQQYKYYENTPAINSKLQEPIAYMFCHWKKNKDKAISYKLFMYNKKFINTNLTVLDMIKILNLTKASEIRKNHLEEDKLLQEDVKLFIKQFNFEQVDNLENEEVNVAKLISNTLHKSIEASKQIYLPLISQYIHTIAIKKSKKERTISLASFLYYIQKIDESLWHNFTKCSTNDQRLVNTFVNQMKNLEYSDNHNYSYVLRFGSSWKNRINAEMINKIAGLFAYKNNRVTNKPVTFLLDFCLNDIFSLKKELLTKNYNGTFLTMNDGYENILFNKELFENSFFFTTSRNGNNYEDVSFNYRIASNNHDFSSLQSCDIFIFNFDLFSDNNNIKDSDRSVNFTGFQSDFILKLMRKLAK